MTSLSPERIIMKFDWHWRLYEWMTDGPMWRVLLWNPIILITLPFVILDVLYDLAKALR